MSIDIQLFKQAMSQWASGVTVVTTEDEGSLHGMTASSFASLSLTPVLVMFNVFNTATTLAMIQKSQKFAINILSEAQAEWGKLFAGMMSDITDPFSNIDYTTAVTGSPILPNVLSWVDCRLYRLYEGGDHMIVVGEVVAVHAQTEGKPLTYFNRTWGTFSAT